MDASSGKEKPGFIFRFESGLSSINIIRRNEESLFCIVDAITILQCPKSKDKSYFRCKIQDIQMPLFTDDIETGLLNAFTPVYLDSAKIF